MFYSHFLLIQWYEKQKNSMLKSIIAKSNGYYFLLQTKCEVFLHCGVYDTWLRIYSSRCSSHEEVKTYKNLQNIRIRIPAHATPPYLSAVLHTQPAAWKHFVLLLLFVNINVIHRLPEHVSKTNKKSALYSVLCVTVYGARA